MSDEDDFAPKRAKGSDGAVAASPRKRGGAKAPTAKAPPKAAASRRKSNTTVDEEDDDEPVEADDEEDVLAKKKPKATASRRKSSNTTVDDGDEVDDNASSSSSKRLTPKKAVGDAKPKAAAAAKPKGVNEKDAGGYVLEYMNTQNRPYSLINVFDNLHGAVKKAALQRVLDKLEADAHLKAKVYGKAKIYWPDQAQYGEISEAMITELQGQVAELTAQSQATSVVRRDAEGNVARLSGVLPTEELRVRVADTEERLEKLRSRLEACEEAAAERGGGGDSKSGSSKPAFLRNKGKRDLEAMLTKLVKVWKERKGMAMEVLGQIEEGSSMKRKALYEKAGIETDDEAKCPDPRSFV
jgi:26S proteasome regulatory subunit, ATPase 3, interacting protein